MANSSETRRPDCREGGLLGSIRMVNLQSNILFVRISVGLDLDVSRGKDELDRCVGQPLPDWVSALYSLSNAYLWLGYRD